MEFNIKRIAELIIIFNITCILACSKKSNPTPTPIPTPTPTPAATNDITFYLTKSDQSVLLQKQSTTISFTSTPNNLPDIVVDSSSSYQSIDGFGYTLTGGSAALINKMDASSKGALLKELFGKDSTSIGISYLRISIGASDLSSSVFSYDDIPVSQEDIALNHFNLSNDTLDLIPLLKSILVINPQLKIMGSPWSAPAWMKDNQDTKGGSLLAKYYPVYAQYFIRYIKAMASNGIPIDAITIQNEPQNPGNNPSMVMSAIQQADFIINHLGPAFKSSNISTKIIVWDHNCDLPSFPLSVLNDAGAKQYVNGSAFHLYGGDISALSTVHSAHPDRDVYFTEQWTGAKGEFGGDLRWHMRNVVIGSMRNWSKTALEWNLANDPGYGPHTPGGCTECKGALTINGSSINRNVSYYIIAHAAKFIPPGSIRINSSITGTVYTAAFITPNGKKILLAVNDGNVDTDFNLSYNSKKAKVNLSAGGVGTFIWQ